MYVFAAGIQTLFNPYFYQVFPNAPTEPVKLPTVNYSDFGFPDLHITLPDPPKWTLTMEGTNFDFVRLVKLQTVHGRGADHYFQFEVKPSGAADHTLKTFEGAVYEQFYPTPGSWPATCRLVGPNSQRYVPLSVGKFTVTPSTMSTPLPFK